MLSPAYMRTHTPGVLAEGRSGPAVSQSRRQHFDMYLRELSTLCNLFLHKVSLFLVFEVRKKKSKLEALKEGGVWIFIS